MKSKKVGIVADLCVICHGIRTFSINKVTQKSKLLGYEKECSECKIKSKTEISFYSDIIRKKNITVENLISKTFPHIRETYREELRKYKFVDEENLQMLKEDERLELLKEPFDIFIPFIAKRHPAQIYIDRLTIKSSLFTFIIPILLIFSPKPNLPHNLLLYFYYFAGLFLIIGSAFSSFYLLTANKLYLQKIITPRIAKSIAPLNPTKEEIEMILDQLEYKHSNIVKYLNIDYIMGYIKIISNSNSW